MAWAEQAGTAAACQLLESCIFDMELDVEYFRKKVTFCLPLNNFSNISPCIVVLKKTPHLSI